MNLSQEKYINDIINNEGLEKSTSIDTIKNANALYDGRFFKLIFIDSNLKIKTECQLCVPKMTHRASTTATFNLKRHLKVSFHFRF